MQIQYKRYHDKVVADTTQLHTSKPELRFCAGSIPDCGISEISHGENL